MTQARALCSVVFSLCFLFFLFGSRTIFLLSSFLFVYALGPALGHSQLVPWATWAVTVYMLFAFQVNDGYEWSDLSPALSALDGFRGLLRWDIYFKMSFLRLISFSMDRHWFVGRRPVAARRAAGGRGGHHDAERAVAEDDCYAARTDEHLPGPAHYGLLYFLAYTTYVPLFVAGPICSYNAFVSQWLEPVRGWPLGRVLRGFAWIAAVGVGFEVLLHFIYLYSVNQYLFWVRKGFAGWEVHWTGYWTLTFMWLKFLVIWRFFRLWALGDGIDTKENMGKCVHNNCTFAGFWKGWHASFNLWTVRYMYIPLGGRTTQAYSIWLIFFFIGGWHDLIRQWFAWALLNCVCFSLEMVLTKRCQALIDPSHPWFVAVRGIGGSVTIIGLEITNLCIMHGFGDGWLFFKMSFLSDWSGPAQQLLYNWSVTVCQVLIAQNQNKSHL